MENKDVPSQKEEVSSDKPAINPPGVDLKSIFSNAFVRKKKAPDSDMSDK